MNSCEELGAQSRRVAEELRQDHVAKAEAGRARRGGSGTSSAPTAVDIRATVAVGALAIRVCETPAAETSTTFVIAGSSRIDISAATNPPIELPTTGTGPVSSAAMKSSIIEP